MITKTRQLLASSSFVKNSLALISGTVVTQAIVFLFSPILARIYGIEDFGNLANFNAWVTILALVSSLRYEHAIIVARGRDNTHRVIALTVVLSALSFVVYEVLALAVTGVGSRIEYVRQIRAFVPLIPIGVLFVCVSSLFTQLNFKSGHFRRLALVAAGQVVFTVVPQIVLGIVEVSHGLILGTIIGFAFSGMLLGALSLSPDMLRNIRQYASMPMLKATAREHVNFPRYTLGADAITVVSQQFIPVFLLALFSPFVAGLYSFAIRVVRVPLIVVATAIAGALRKEASDRLHGGASLAPLVSLTVRTLLLVAVIPLIIVLLYGDAIFAAIFGAKWAAAGTVVQILSPGILCEFVAFPLAVMFLATNTQRYSLALQLSGFVLLCAALYVGRHYFSDFIATCYLISLVMVVVNGTGIMLAARVARRSSAERHGVVENEAVAAASGPARV
ncbi:MAG: oligosaccharide flippase family protein [Gemmatimonadaceae bacterium]